MSRVAARVLPGFGLTLGYTILYLSLIVLIPLSATFLRSTELGVERFIEVVTAPRVLASLQLSFGASLLAALVNGVFGFIVAWVLVRHNFPGRKVVDKQERVCRACRLAHPYFAQFCRRCGGKLGE